MLKKSEVGGVALGSPSLHGGQRVGRRKWCCACYADAPDEAVDALKRRAREVLRAARPG